MVLLLKPSLGEMYVERPSVSLHSHTNRAAKFLQVYFGTFFVCDRTKYLKQLGSTWQDLPFVAVGDTLEVLSSASQ